MPEDFIESYSYEKRLQLWVETASNLKGGLYVATEKEGEIVGFAYAGPERTGHLRYKGELYAIYLLEGYQGRGLGRALVVREARWLRSERIDSMLVWVLAGNPACRFYERLGAVEVDAKTVRQGEVILREVAYGWESLEGFEPSVGS